MYLLTSLELDKNEFVVSLPECLKGLQMHDSSLVNNQHIVNVSLKGQGIAQILFQIVVDIKHFQLDHV